MKKTLLSCMLMFFMALTAQANIIYVRIGASGNNDGTSWDNAYTTAFLAIENATAGDSVFVAHGTYVSNNPISIPPYVSIFGGFPYSGNPTFADRDWVMNPSIFSGDVNLNDVPNSPANRSDNSVRIFETNTMYVLDGIIVEHGGNGSVSPGAGLAQGGSSSRSGIIRNCIFRQNRAGANGGAIRGVAMNADDTLIIENTIIHDNTSTYGLGGAIVSNGTLIMNNCKLVNNNSYNGASAIFAACGNFNSTIECTNVLFAKNQSLYGRMIRIDADGSPNSNQSTFNNCTFVHNENTSTHGLFTSVSSYSSTNPFVEINNSILQFGALSSGTMWNEMNNYSINLSNVVCNVSQNDFENGLIFSGVYPPTITYTNELLDTDVTWAVEDSTTAYQYILDCNSVGVNLGDPLLYTGGNTDVDGNPRTSGTTIDYGAFETTFNQNPVINQVGTILNSNNSHATYQWYLDGSPIVGQTSDSLEIFANGDYELVAHSPNGICQEDTVSNTITITDYGVGLAENQLFALEIYPNPAKTMLNLSGVTGKVDIYDATGVLAMRTTEESSSVNISVLHPGVYFLHVKTEHRIISKRFIKN